MNFGKLLDRNLIMALDLAGDLAVTAVFHKKVGASFNFSTAAVEHPAEATVTTDALLLDVSKRGDKVVWKNLLFRTTPVGDLGLYDSVTIGGVSYKISAPIRNVGLVALIEVYREV